LWITGTTSKLASCGIAELLANILKHYSNNDTLLALTCEIIYTLIIVDLEECDDGNTNHLQDKLGDYLICEYLANNTVLYDMDHIYVGSAISSTNNASFTYSLNTLSFALKAIGALARRHDANKKRFSSNAVCSLVPTLCLKEKKVISDVVFAEAVCWCLANLAYPDEQNQIDIGKSHGVDLIYDILQLYAKTNAGTSDRPTDGTRTG
jgi:hypothetical protein